MPCRGKGYLEPFCRFERLMVVQGLKMFERFPSVFLGKQRLRLLVLRELLAEGVLGVFFLQVARIRQQHLAQLMGRLGAVDLALEAILH